MRKAIFLVSLLLLTVSAKSEIVRSEININDATISYSSGFLMASLYDLAVDSLPYNSPVFETLGPQPFYFQQNKDGYWSIPSPFGEYKRYWAWKLGLSTLTGFVWELHSADRDNRQISFENIGWGALGGLTSVVIHF